MGANAQTSVPVFTSGQVLTAQQQTEINTGIPVFADSTARDAAFGGAGEKVLAEGQFAFLEDSDTTQYYDGSTWEAVGVAPGLVLISSTTIGTTVASVTVTGAFSATYDAYEVIVSGGASSTNNELNLTFGATSTGYRYGTIGNNYSTTGAFSGSTSTTAIKLIGTGFTTSISLSMRIVNPFLNEYTLVSGGLWLDSGNIGSTRGSLDNTTSYTDFTITTSTGTLTGGTIRVYGYTNS